MYNANYPKDNELPSSKQLIISTLGAFVVAGILLVTAILPAEYGIDPTGIGGALGLTQMGEIKMQLAEEAAQEDAVVIAELESTAPEVEPVVESQEEVVSQSALASDSIQITLEKGEAAEVKVAMNEGQVVTYTWTLDTGHLSFDNHGDNPSIKYHNYSKGTAVTSDKGEIRAAFDGRHGWFWRNRSDTAVTVTLEVTGNYTSFERLL